MSSQTFPTAVDSLDPASSPTTRLQTSSTAPGSIYLYAASSSAPAPHLAYFSRFQGSRGRSSRSRGPLELSPALP
jgi:hypothetical protein